MSSTPSKDFISGGTRCGQESRVNATTTEIMDDGGGVAVDMRSAAYDDAVIPGCLTLSVVEVGGDGDTGA
jgi:hypothetical protein